MTVHHHSRVVPMPMNPRLLRPLATGFNPKSIAGLGLWLDAASASTLTLNSGNVSEWRDKSGNGRDFAQTDAARQPSLGTMNGKTSLDFGGDLLLGNAASKKLFRNVGGGTLIVAASSAAQLFRTLFNATTGASNLSARFFLGQSNSPSPWLMGGRRLDADSFQNIEWTGTASPLGPSVLSVVLDYANSDAFLYGDGALVNSTTSFQTDGNTSDTDSQEVGIGASPSYTNTWDGLVSEILAWPRVLTAAERQRVERYLGRKWGITVA